MKKRSMQWQNMMECTNNGIKYKQFVITLIPIYIRCFDQKHLIRFIYIFCSFFLFFVFWFSKRSGHASSIMCRKTKSFLGK